MPVTYAVLIREKTRKAARLAGWTSTRKYFQPFFRGTLLRFSSIVLVMKSRIHCTRSNRPASLNFPSIMPAVWNYKSGILSGQFSRRESSVDVLSTDPKLVVSLVADDGRFTTFFEFLRSTNKECETWRFTT